MARVIIFALVAAGWLSGQVKDAGECARCHVTSSVEWGLSKHAKASTGCTVCHGESTGHVLDEQNGVKPNRIPRGRAAVTASCAECHKTGCPKTAKTADCQSCHHIHALLDPNIEASADQRARELETRMAAYRERMADGEKAMKTGEWKAAREAFRAALSIHSTSEVARENAILCARKLNPSIPGFSATGAVDARTTLPKQIRFEKLGIDLVLIPGGDCDLGSETRPGAKPVHTVRVAPFYLAVHEVTQAQWSALMDSNPSRRQGAELPVESVSWHDARKFIAALNTNADAAGFRLPTEAEWEYVARRKDTGVVNMAGGVSEWCSSLAAPYPYNAADGRESLTAHGLRVLRGGNYAQPSEWMDLSERHPSRPDKRLPFNGIRLAFSPPEPPQ